MKNGSVTPEEYRLDVLIVAADDEYRLTLTDLMRLHGYKTVGVRTASEAVLLYHAGWTPKVTIIDLNQMTKADWAIIGPVADEQQRLNICVVFIAASMATPISGKAAMVLPKPVDFRNLLSVMKHCSRGETAKRPSTRPRAASASGSL
jgi:DNA-binding NtrC family response regulator